MQKNLDIVVSNLNGEPLLDSDKVIVKLSSIAMMALLQGTEGEPARKVKRYFLAQAIHNNPSNVELSSEDIVDLKTLVGRMFGPLVVGQFFSHIED